MALDLTKQVPRSPFDRLDGFAWLPRLIDKARAYYAGTHGDYTPYPCPGDGQFLKYFGLDAQDLGKLIQSGASDEEIVAHVKRSTKRTEAEKEAFWRDYFVPPSNPLKRFAFGLFISHGLQRLKATRPGLDLTNVDTMAKLLAVEEGHPIPPAPQP